jgi:hypothetical protein
MKKVLLLLPLASIAFADDYQIHILKDGETLSELLLERGYTPLYGKNQWVDKTLLMNHLNADNVAKIKKGFPIILPKKEDMLAIEIKELEKDFVSTKSAARMRTGLFGNTISEDQKVFLEVDYYSSNIKLQNSNISLNENYGLGVKVDGENDYRLGTMTYNVNGSFFFYTHGTGQFDKIDNITASYDPTLQLESHLEIQAPEVSFNFGPSLLMEERSRVSESGNDIIIRRDRAAWLGFQVNKIMEIDHLRYEAQLGLRRKFYGQNLNAEGDFNASSVYASTKVNLSSDYDFAVKLSSTQYDNIGINSEDSIGANFSYNLK